jgi:cell division protein FtsB
MDKSLINWRRVAAFIGIALLTLAVIEFNNRLDELNRLDEKVNEVRADATQAVQTQAALQTQVAFATSDAAVDQYAREDNHMVQEGDIPGAPVGNSANPIAPTPTPAPVSTPMPYWQAWWNLFFGK